MPFSLLRSLVRACGNTAHPSRRRRHGGDVGRRNRAVATKVEPLEQRMALTVAAPSIGLAVASDTGIRGDGITRLVRPAFVGVAPARSNVVVYADGRLLGVTRATAQGAWTLATPAAKPLAPGAHTMTAYAVGPSQVWSTATARSITVDVAPPTATLTYDKVLGIATLTFSEPVSGVRPSNLMLSGRMQSGVTIPNVPITNAQLSAYIGGITTEYSSDGKTVTFREGRTLADEGSYTLTFVKNGVVDRAGNQVAANVSTRFTIV